MLRASGTRERNPVQYHIDAFDSGLLPRLESALFDADPSALADYDAARKTLRVSTLLPHAQVLDALASAGMPVVAERLQLMPSECCGGCGG